MLSPSIQVNSRGSCSNLVNREIFRSSVEAGLRPFKDNMGNEGSLGSSLGWALVISSKAAVESQAGPSTFGPSLLVKQPIRSGHVLCQEGVLSPFITRTSGIPMETQANPLVQEKSLGLKEWELGIDKVFVAEATGLIGRFSSLSPPPPSSCPFLKVEHFARAGPSLGSPASSLSHLD